MAQKLTTYEPAEDLGSDEAIAYFMTDAFETNDASYITHALDVVARAKGMTQIALADPESAAQKGVRILHVSYTCKRSDDSSNAQ